MASDMKKDTAQLIKIAFPSILFTDDTKRLCNCHNKFVYQFLECPNCKGIMCMNNFFKESSLAGQSALATQEILDAFEGNHVLPSCRFCNILFVSSAKLQRTTCTDKNIRAYHRLDMWLLGLLGLSEEQLLFPIVLSERNQIKQFMRIMDYNLSFPEYMFQLKPD